MWTSHASRAKAGHARRPAAGAALAIALCAPAAQAVVFDTVAFSEGPVPGLAGRDASFRSFGAPTLNDAGEVAFTATLEGSFAPSGRDSGVWAGAAGSLRNVALEGSVAPGGGAFSFFQNPALSNDGQTAFSARLVSTPFSRDTGLYSERTGVLGLVAQEGGPNTFGGGGNFGSITVSKPAINEGGATVFVNTLTGVPSDRNATLLSQVRSPRVFDVAREGASVPGIPGAQFSFFSSDVVINAEGQTAFRATLQREGGVTSANDGGIWSDVDGRGYGNHELIAREGSMARGVDGRTSARLFSSFQAPVINDAGDLAFRANLVTGTAGVTFDDNSGIWFRRPDGLLEQIVREGDNALGTGVPSFAAFQSLALGGDGTMAFRAQITGLGVDNTNNSGIWTATTTDGLDFVTQEGRFAPGGGNVARFSAFDSPVVNGEGLVAFGASLTGPGIDLDNNYGIWAQAASGFLELIVREGDLLPVGLGDFRTVSQIGFANRFTPAGDEDGRRRGFNDAGQVAFSAVFTDGSTGVFVASAGDPAAPPPPGVPEPGTALLCALALLARAGHRRTHER